MDVLLCFGLDMCFGYSWELSHERIPTGTHNIGFGVARYEKEAQVMEVLLYTGLNMCFGNSWELSHRDGSFEYLLKYMCFFLPDRKS